MRSIGPYRIAGPLGRGGMGTVYKVFHQHDETTPYALKLFAPHAVLVSLLGRKETARRFHAEIATLQALDHPHVARVLDTGCEADNTGQTAWFVMEYCCDTLGSIAGEDYEAEKQSRIIPVEKAVTYTRQILQGLSALHNAGIIHRDIKPFNILLPSSGIVKIIDLGLSRVRGEPFPCHRAEKIGSPYYAAPEQESSPDTVDRTVDIYAVGILLQRMLTGYLPQIACDIASRCNPDLIAARGAWDTLLATATATDPRRRFPDALSMREALEHCFVQWQASRPLSCFLYKENIRDDSCSQQNRQKTSLRNTPVHTGPCTGPEVFGADALGRPVPCRRTGFVHKKEVFIDTAMKRIWQRVNRQKTVNWHEAQQAVQQLNAVCFAGYADWRLPTAEELLCLLYPPETPPHCLPDSLNELPTHLWSADRRTYTQAWYANREHGYIGWHDMDCPGGVCAVRNCPIC